MRIELYILGAQVFDFIITKDPKKTQIGFEPSKIFKFDVANEKLNGKIDGKEST